MCHVLVYVRRRLGAPQLRDFGNTVRRPADLGPESSGEGAPGDDVVSVLVVGATDRAASIVQDVFVDEHGSALNPFLHE